MTSKGRSSAMPVTHLLPNSSGPNITAAQSDLKTGFHNNSSQSNVAPQAAVDLEIVQQMLARRAFVESFPVSVYSLPDEGIDAEECVICCVEFEGGSNLILLPLCGHVFHRECMASYWEGLARERPCPLCRHDYETWQPDVP